MPFFFLFLLSPPVFLFFYKPVPEITTTATFEVFKNVTLVKQEPEESTEEDGEDDEPPVPVVLVVYGGYAQEHEDDRL
jgi:hypothetical protein